MNLVLDTNIVVSGIIWRGPPHELLQRVFAGEATTWTCAESQAELLQVLNYPKLRGLLQERGLEPERITERYAALCRWVRIAPLVQPICRDPQDDRLLACTLTAKADALVSGDDDLLSLRAVNEIPIITAVECLRRLTANKPAR
jgi:putative PIN family toxin of toxin-antitoxin system